MSQRTLLILALLLSAAAVCPAAKETEEQLRAKLAVENNPVRKARLAVRLGEMDLDAAGRLYEGNEWEKGAATLEKLLEDVELAYASLTNSGRDARRSPSGFKDTEIKMRVFLRRLEDLRTSLPLDERPTVDKVMTRVREIQQALLNALMHVKPKKEKSKEGP